MAYQDYLDPEKYGSSGVNIATAQGRPAALGATNAGNSAVSGANGAPAAMSQDTAQGAVGGMQQATNNLPVDNSPQKQANQSGITSAINTAYGPGTVSGGVGNTTSTPTAATMGMQNQGSPSQVIQGVNPMPTGVSVQDKPNGWTPPPGYLQGATNQQLNPQNNPANMSGQGQKGYALGMMAGQEMLNNRDSNNRANETQGWTRQEVLKQQQISAGMQQAAAQGGYGGVIDYLRTADPERALKIQQQKTDLDQSMLKSDSLKMLNDQQRKAGLFQGYALLGKMGATILAAPQDQRQALWNHMLPMARAVVPDAPTDLASATPMLMLGAGQSMPDSAIWAAKKDSVDANSAVGKAQQDYRDYVSKGGDTNSDYAVALRATINQSIQDGILKQANVDELATKKVANQADSNNKLLNTVSTITKNYTDNPVIKNYTQFDPAWQRFQAAQQALSANPNDPTAKRQMGLAIIGLNGVRRASPALADYFLDTGSDVDQFMEHLQSKIDPNGQVVAGSDEIKRLSDIGQRIHDKMAAPVAQVNNIYQNQANAFNILGSGIDIKSQIPWVNTGSNMPSTEAVPSKEVIDSQAQQALERGKLSPLQVQQLKQEQYHKYGYQ